jgi:hypothetical protein
MTIKFSIPTNWNDLSNKQLLKIAMLFFSSQKSTVIRDYKLFKIMANVKWYKFGLYRKIVVLFKQIPLISIRKQFDFIYSKQNLTRFIPLVKHKRKKYFAPADRLTNLSIGEFSVCEDLYLGYLRNIKNADADFGKTYLVYLFAVLYVGSKNAKRPLFEKQTLENTADKLHTLNEKYLFTTLLSYKGCRDAITSNPKYKHIFPKPPQTEEKTVLKIPASSGFSDVILSFSGKLFGEYDKTYHTNLYTFLDAYENMLQYQPKNK